MSAGLRKAVLSAHLAVSVGWIGAVVAYLCLGIAATTTSEPQTTRAAWIAMELTGWYAIVPLALTSLVTGIVMAIGTKWGLFRHYWVVISLGLTVFATAILVLHMPTVSATAALVQEAEGQALDSFGGDLGHPAVGLVVLLLIHVLNIYKPAGLTRYGWRKQQEQARSAKTVERV